MKHVPKKELSQNLRKESSNLIIRDINKIKSSTDLLIFLGKFFTDKEKDLIMRRAAVEILLESGATYRKIKNLLEISQGTISRVRDVLDGRGYGRNPDRKRIYSSFPRRKRKERKLFRPYKGAESII